MPGDSILPLEGMLEALRRLERYAEVGVREGFPQEGALTDAVLRRVDLLSAHANSVSEGLVEEHPGLPWRRLRALRDVVKAYGGGDPDLAWTFVRNHVPGLRRGVEELVEEVRRADSGSSHPAAGPQLFAGRVLVVHPGRVAVVQLEATAPLPGWAAAAGGAVASSSPPSPLRALIRTPSEWTFYGPEEEVPEVVSARRGLRMMELLGPLPSDTVGVMAGLAAPLARAGIPLLTLSTFGTDLILVGEDRLDEACATLGRAGYRLPGAD
jgi:uncharacterized protein